MKIKTLGAIILSNVLMVGCIKFKDSNEMKKFNFQSDYQDEDRELTVRDFFKNSEVAMFRLSPDGEDISYLAPYESRMNIFVLPVGGGEPVRLTSETDRSIMAYAWVNNERIVYLKDTGGDENYQLYGVKKDGSDFKDYTANPQVMVQIADLLEDNDEEILIAMNERNPQVFDIYRLNVNTGEKRLVCENPGNIQGWMMDHNGVVRVAYTIEDGVNTSILYRENENEEFRKVLTTNYKDEVSFKSFDPENKYVYATTNIGRDKAALVLMDPNTCEEIEVLYENPKYDVDDIVYSDAKDKLLAASCIGHQFFEYKYFDEDFKEIRERINEALPESENFITDWDKNEDMAIVASTSDRNPGTYYLFSKNLTRKLTNEKTKGNLTIKLSPKSVKVNTYYLTKIADCKPWIKPFKMCSMIPVEYTSRDGLNIEAYLTLPNGMTIDSAKNLSVVINPHGGPWARDIWEYNPEVQFLASKGYAVLQMNFRGSTGYGRNHKELSYKQWGQTMQDDITDGVNWLIEKGIADPKRIAIYGGSYGGYATLRGITKDPDLYACAIDYVGVSNLFTFMEAFPPYWKPLLQMMYDMVGDPEKDKDMLTDNSPIFMVDRIKTPLFVAQGANDPRVNKSESDQMVEALRARGVDVDYMVKDNEGHGFANEENRFEFYEAMETFLAKYLK